MALKKRMKKIFIRTIYSLLLIFLALPVLAGDGGLSDAAKGLDLKKDAIPVLVGRVLGGVLGLTGTIFFVLVVYAGLMWMTSAGNEESSTKAKKILTAAIIGLIIVLSAYAITTFVGNSLG